MPSKPLAYLLLVLACMVAAGVGAFVATYQQPRAVPSLAPLVASAPARTPPQPVGAVRTTTTSPGQPAAAKPPAVPPAAAKVALAKPASTNRGAKSPRSEAQPQSESNQDRHPDVAQAAPAPPSPPMSQGGVDPNPQAGRPWPGPPASQPPLQPPPPASGAVVGLGRVEPEAPPEENTRQWLEVVVPAESVVGLQLESTISTEYARIEDQVDARVTRDVRVGGHVVIPAGTQVIGSVTMVERGGRMKDRARLGFRFHTLVFADQSRVSISTDAVYRLGESPADRSSAKIGGAAIGGAIIGAILGGGKGAAIGSGIGAAGGAAAVMRGDRLPVVVPAGTTLSVRTLAPLSLPIEK